MSHHPGVISLHWSCLSIYDIPFVCQSLQVAFFTCFCNAGSCDGWRLWWCSVSDTSWVGPSHCWSWRPWRAKVSSSSHLLQPPFQVVCKAFWVELWACWEFIQVQDGCQCPCTLMPFLVLSQCMCYVAVTLLACLCNQIHLMSHRDESHDHLPQVSYCISWNISTCNAQAAVCLCVWVSLWCVCC